MQRQSLGSPSSKLYNGRAGGPSAEDGVVSHSASASSSSSSPIAVSPVSAGAGFTFSVDEEEFKFDKPMRRRSSVYHSRPERLVHVIPVLILLCILVLYLFSHEPSPKDLAHFRGFRHPSDLIEESTEIDNIGRQAEKRQMVGIRSLRNLQEIRQRYNSHRKLANF